MEWGGGGVCAGGRQDLGMIVWSYLQWGTPDRGIRTVASDKEAINILEAQDGTLLGRICWSYHEPGVTTILCGDPWDWIGFLIFGVPFFVYFLKFHNVMSKFEIK